MERKPIPVIVDTDIGCDIDDTWALAMLLKSPELDMKLVVSAFHDTTYKAKLCAKMLEIAGREDIPVAIGINTGNICRHIEDWVSDYDLSSYPSVIEDGVQAIIDTVMSSDETVTIIALGPMTNIAEAYRRCPQISKKARILGLLGNLNHAGGRRENNIWCDIEAYRDSCEKSDFEVEMIPLDLTACTILDEERYEKISSHKSSDPLIAALIENSKIWYKNMGFEFEGKSSCLFDTVGIYAAFTHENLEYERLPIFVGDDGITVIDEKQGKLMDVGVRWGNKEDFYDFLVLRMTGQI